MKRKTDNFSKFFNRKSNSAIKEAFKQEKKEEKKARKEAIERHFEKKREAKAARAGSNPADTPPAGKFRKTGSQSSHSPSDAKHTPGAHMPPGAKHVPGAPGHDAHLIPVNKYIAHGGICSRRDAAELIRQGKVSVNGKLVTEPGTKVSPSDLVMVNGKKVTISRNFVYILLNKPKDYITTTDDPHGRKTVLDLIRQATTERVYPVGRLDRNTSGVLLLTNDGELAQKLAHPRHEVKKIYHVTLDKVLTKADFDKIINGGVILEDGPAFVDVIAYADARDKTQIGLEIHSGRNRIVRRIFEHLGYDVRGLDRVMYAGLTKKNVQRGKWRMLLEKEIRILKYLNSSVKGSASNKGTPKERAALDRAALDLLTQESMAQADTAQQRPVPNRPRPKKDRDKFAQGDDKFAQDHEDLPAAETSRPRKNFSAGKPFSPGKAGKSHPGKSHPGKSHPGKPAEKSFEKSKSSGKPFGKPSERSSERSFGKPAGKRPPTQGSFQTRGPKKQGSSQRPAIPKARDASAKSRSTNTKGRNPGSGRNPK